MPVHALKLELNTRWGGGHRALKCILRGDIFLENKNERAYLYHVLAVFRFLLNPADPRS